VPQAPVFSRPGKSLRRAVGASVLCSLLMGGTAGFGAVELVSGSDPGNPSATPNGQSIFSALSADGRYVVFISEAVNVVSDQRDANGGTDVFLRDQVAGTTVLVSHAAAAASSTGNAPSGGGQISADGRYVLFGSTATNLVTGQIDTPDTFDLFLYDRVTGTTVLVSRSSASPRQAGNGSTTPFTSALSADGRWVVFASSATNLVSGQADGNASSDVFLFDRVAGTTALVSRSASFPTRAGNALSSDAGLFSVSSDGGQILFLSEATDLVPGGTTGHNPQLFLFNRLSGATTLVSHLFGAPAAGSLSPVQDAALSADGGWVAFVSDGANLVPDVPGFGKRHLYLYQRTSGAITRVTRTDDLGNTEKPRLSADGRYVAFISNARDLAPEQNGQGGRDNVFLYDRVTATTLLVSRSLTSAEQFPVGLSRPLSISADGRFVAYDSEYTDLVPGQIDTSGEDTTEDVFLFDRASRTNRLVSHTASSSTQAAGGVQYPLAISANGRYVGFSSYASGIVEGKRDFNRSNDVLLYDSSRDDSEIVSLREGQPSPTGAFSRAKAISADGRYVLFNSDAPNLVPGQRDANDHDTIPRGDQFDVFLYDRVSRARTLASHSSGSPTTTGNGPSQGLSLSPDGRWAVFFSQATDLVPGQSDDNGGADIFLFDRSSGAVTLVSHRAGLPSTTGHGQGFVAQVSADGRFVAFESTADDLVPGQTAAGQTGVFLFDRVTGAIQLVSHAAGSPTTPASPWARFGHMSLDGRFITFTSYATDLVPGQVSFGAGLNTFLFDRVAGTTMLVNHIPSSPTTASNGDSSQSSRISADGRFVAFGAVSSDLTPESSPGIFLFDRLSGGVTFAGRGERVRDISADGRFVTFTSTLTDLVPGQVDASFYTEDVFLYDRISGATTLVSHAPGKPATTMNQTSAGGGLSADGGVVTFWNSGVFLYHRVSGEVQLISGALGSPVQPGNGSSYNSIVSSDGRSLAFESEATNLIPGISTAYIDVYLYSLDGTTPGGPVTVPPCGLFSGPLRSNARKVLKVAGACGVPAGAKKVTVKLTVSQGTGKGNVQLYAGNVRNPSSGILRFERGATRAASFTLPLSTNGTGTIALLPFVGGNGTVRVSVEVNGYTP
jgi:Tol biopolymer transport system component